MRLGWFRHEGGKRTGSEPSTCGRRPARTLIKSPVARLAVYASLNGWGWVGEDVTCNLQRFLVTSSPTRHMYSTRAASAIACAGCSHPPRKKWPQRRVLTSAFTSKRRLADDLTELGDNATVALVRQAIDCFQAWKFEAGEELLERALEERHRHEHEPPRSPYFNTPQACPALVAWRFLIA